MIAGLAGLLAAASCAAAEPSDAPGDAAGTDPGMQALRSAILQAAGEPAPERLDPGRLQLFAMGGREDLVEARLAELGYGGPRCCGTLTEGAPAIETIVDQARRTRIVVINEDHARPRHRAFIADLARALRAEGYSIYAAEAFRPGADLNGEIGPAMGRYLAEPEFARLVESVRRAGYALRAYEAVDEAPGDNPRVRTEAREAAQAHNIASILRAAGPGEKLLIHAGHAHASEEPLPFFDGEPIAWMAARLEALTGTDPLTIDLTACTGPDAEFTIAQPDAGNPFAPRTDLTVATPRGAVSGGRPGWRRARAGRVVAAPELPAASGRALILEVRVAGASDRETPWDRVLVRPGEPVPLLFAPEAPARLDVYDVDGRVWSARLAPGASS